MADIWLPIAQQPYLVDGSTLLTDPSNGGPSMWARLAPGVTPSMAEAELLNLTNERRKLNPKDVWKDEYVRSDPAGHLQIMEPQLLRWL